MRPPIDDAVILLTGASSGIGREMARLLAPRARALALVARRRERLEQLREELSGAREGLAVSVHACDLADLDAVSTMLGAVRAEHGDPDVLINNAGLGDAGLFDRTDWNKTRQMIRVNVEALTLLTRELVPNMVERGRGGVLNVSSGFGLSFMPGFATYAGTKHYVTAFTEGLRLDLRGTGVVVSQVCPGPVETEFNEIAGVPDAVSPRLLRLSASRCARVALRGFERNRALVVPGVLMSVLLWANAFTPRWVLRLLYWPVSRALRRRLPPP
jgi:short-subunit dehydrogenase